MRLLRRFTTPIVAFSLSPKHRLGAAYRAANSIGSRNSETQEHHGLAIDVLLHVPLGDRRTVQDMRG